ncbi:hypothetical protein GPJ56_000238 [Histomonas meleagridis]|uniref:uncharacterized protein n=1 Tax=Histomonas meleagridis TaxID=135588 RepID=UPI00355A339F|nr:hypothetical protein GPJ56_000238 [Histomonas meleagridis]KAH0799725.1 hypothetical protein GO595_007446 [Histomonas meleagridis]
MAEKQTHETQKSLFEATVPIRFTIQELNVPLCFNANRNMSLGYFVFNFLGNFIEEENLDDMWFCSEGKPIKWELPLGVIYDIFIPQDNIFTPLTIEIRFEDFPEDRVQKCDSLQVVKQIFIDSFKESCSLTHDTNFAQANPDIQGKIWRSIDKKDSKEFISSFELYTKDINSWKMWPIKLIDKELNITDISVNVEEGQNFRNLFELKGVKADAVKIQGINIPLETPLKNIVETMLYPDGFLYATII